MEFVDPIRDIGSINEIKRELKKQSQRDVLLFVLGINTGIRVSDLLYLKVKDLWDGKGIKEFLYIKGDKIEEVRAFYLNNSIKNELTSYMNLFDFSENDYLFKSKKNEQPITRQQAYRIINNAAKKVGVAGKIGTHTLRKTFGYHAYRKGIAISILMSIYNHHTPAETLRYIGINKNEQQLIKVDVNL
ncbi:site-specific recombinase XerD [Cytobacillus horneckiae]|uniref:Site-specific integrase n=1 Tax=Cytobacillus horneckiae TaxID=549687 RepID=A0A2N0ZAT3_9BACI|nr:tyrosine-type recombinase/integrase [Cytobacillus horneckiae]NRG48260.1 tyrosine-type recombinase/integrase [Bacillus sp. CRN 9]MBN6887849.1 tyrosine-type recombinase/integrase [Cytobacillus horneckiae]MCM3179795.1 tyrosine-type recombinase/integrase [Cytobacillus horneckiae]MEC1155182.1 tyrosine-type recombinase/integrase [Cytobacillus horneckiae]MED2936765.1 tyrosine-type recombinase/integrase [Cytobacillus horneckiae]